jgi:hypothetical protein
MQHRTDFAFIECMVEGSLEDRQYAIGACFSSTRGLLITIGFAILLLFAGLGSCPWQCLSESPMPLANLIGGQVCAFLGAKCRIDIGDSTTS